MRLMMPLWGPFLCVEEGVELSKRALTQTPFLKVSPILILGSQSLLMTPALGMVKARRRKKREMKRMRRTRL